MRNLFNRWPHHGISSKIRELFSDFKKEQGRHPPSHSNFTPVKRKMIKVQSQRRQLKKWIEGILKAVFEFVLIFKFNCV